MNQIIDVIHDGLFIEGHQEYIWDVRNSGDYRRVVSYICRLITEKSIYSGRIQIMY